MNALKVCPQCGTEYPANARFCEIDGTALRSAAGQQDMVGSIVAERYHVMKKLGEGGMGQVYLAEHVKMGRKSALKVMHPGMVKDVDAISRFNREAANASRISHPNIAAVYDFGETPDGIIFLAMEFVDGPPLTKVIEQSGALPAKRAAEIVRQTGDALAVAHDLGIVHRDLKPDNIMIAKTRDGGDLVKVVDFGIAKAANSEAQKVTKTGLVVGTPEYMSPEQLAGDKLDGRSDIYSLALVAFNMLTGKLPFPSDSAQEAMIMRLTDRPKSLGEMRPDVNWPADVQGVMDKALERDATLRYQTAAEFGRDLQRAIDRMPETTASDLGTQVLSVPPTRVAPPGAEVTPRTSIAPGVPALAPGTVAVPPPRAPAPVTQAAAPPARFNKLLLIGGTLAVVAMGAVAMVMKNGDAGKNVNPPTQTASSQGAKPADTVTQPPAVTPSGTSSPQPPDRSTQNSPANEPSLDVLEAQARDSVNAMQVLASLRRKFPTLQTANDSAQAYFIRYQVLNKQLKSSDACSAIREAVKLAPAKEKYEARLAACGG